MALVLWKRMVLLLGLWCAGHLAVAPVQAATTDVTLDASDAVAAESGSPPSNTGTFTISRPQGARNDGDATVTFSISGTAGNGMDYRLRLPTGALVPAAATSGTVVIPNGSRTADIVVEPLEDTGVEDTESVTLMLTGVTLPGKDYQIGTPNMATVTIEDNDTTISISATDPNAAEAGGNTGTFTVTRRDGVGSLATPPFPVTVNYVISGTAANGTDYNSIGTNVTIASSASSATITITPINDSLNELPETVILTLAPGIYNIAGVPSNTATVTIADNDPQPSVSFASASSSGQENVSPANLTVALSAVSGTTVTVGYAVTGGTATGGGVDYTLASGTLTFAPGVTSQSIPVTVVNDTTDEDDETIQVGLSNPTNAVLGAVVSHTYTILDNDNPPTVSFSSASSSGDESVTPANLAVSLSPASGKTVMVTYSVTGGTATGGGVDYTLPIGTLTFAPGVTSQNVPLTVVDDLIDEPNETVMVALSNPSNATLGGSTHTYTINDNDNPPTVTLSLTGSPMAEGGGMATVTATLSAPSALTVTVNLAFSGTAGSPNDYTRSGASITIPPGSTNGSITLTAMQDTSDEVDETIIVDISTVNNGTELGTQQVTAIITDDDGPTISINDVSVAEGDSGTTNAVFSLTLSASSPQTITVAYATANGTASAGSDYVAKFGNVTFPSNSSAPQTISVVINSDTDFESNETFFVNLSSPVNGTIVDNQGQGTILNDDPYLGGCPTLTFVTQGPFATGVTPAGVAVGDLNGDGKRDLVVANQFSGNVSVLLGKGNGTFHGATNYPVGAGPSSVALGDLNGDAILDMAVADPGGDSVYTLQGTGDGKFQSAVQMSLGEGARCQAVALRDLDGDGQLDLVVANRGFYTISVILRNANGTFKAPVPYDVGIDPVAVVTSVFSNVGNSAPDIAVANAAIFDVPPSVSVLPSGNNGSFGNAVTYANAGASPRSIAVGDFNGDGRTDLAVANSGSGTNSGVSILLANANGTFQAPLTNYSAGANCVSVAVGDFNADTKLDLAVANSASGNVSVLLGNGNGTFQDRINYSAGTSPAALAVGDFDSDGRPDIAVANSSGVLVLLRIDTPLALDGLPSLTVNLQCLSQVPPPPTVTACSGAIPVMYTSSESGPTCNHIITRTWSATDAIGNTVSFTQTITVHDDTPPLLSTGILASNYPTVLAAETAALAATGASDNCSTVTKTVSTVGTCSAVITVTGTDACGNVHSVSYNTRIDGAPPVLSGLPSATLNVQCLAAVPPPPTVTATDNCDGSVAVVYTSNETGDVCNRTITRTWSAMDMSSNAVAFTQTITVHDTTPPTLTKGSIASSYATIGAAETAALAATGASDNCSAVTKTVSSVGTCATTITVTGTDACGNQQTVTYNTLIDNQPPVLSGLPPASLDLECLSAVPAPPTVTATDNCGGSLPVTFTTNQTGTACNRTITRMWSATDAANNTVSFTQTITVIDSVAPTLTKGTIAAGYQTVAEAQAAALAATVASDNCSVTKAASTVGTCTATITVTGTDACGNQQSVTYNTSIDNSAPVLNGLPVDSLTLQCPADVPAPPTVTATDNCAGSVPVTFTTNQTGTACNRTITRTWSSVDPSGNIASFTQTIVVHDDTSPVLTKGSIASGYQNAADAEADALAATGASDNCSMVTKTVSTVAECGQPAVVTVTGTDACGNQQSVSYNTAINNIPPTLIGLPAPTLTVQCVADVPPVPNVTALDDCDGPVPVTLTTNQTGTACNLTITRSWSAMDMVGNTVSFTQTISVQDDNPPTLAKGTIASSYPTVAAAETAALAATTASDNCGMVTKTAATVGTCTAVVTVTGTDACGNQQSVAYNTRIDNVPPLLNGLPALTLTVQCGTDVPALPTVTATDNCDSSVPVILTTNQTGTACNRTITRTWSATDTSGNATNFTQTITVHDTTAPTVTKGTIASSYPTVAAAEAAAVAATSASDNCSTVTNTASTTGTCSAVVTVTATDACGNQQSVTYNTRIDNTPPVFSGLPAATLNVQCAANVPALPNVTATDNCDNSVPVTLTTNQTGTACNRTITRMWSTTDTSGNATNFTQTITVQDTTPPTLTKGTIAATYATVTAAETAALAATSASDNCGTVTKTASTTGTCSAVVTVTGTDACGNVQSVTYNTRIDSTPPVLNGLPSATFNVECEADVPALPTVTATDSCDNSVPVTLTTNQTGTACNLVITRTWSASDTSGNSVSFTQTITVHDSTAPVLTKGVIGSSYQTISAAEAAAATATGASDNCGVVTKTASTVGTCSATITVTGTDSCGNQQSVTYTTRVDGTPPVLGGLPAATLNVQCAADVPALPTVTAMDNCDNSVPVTLTTNLTGTACNLTITRTWSATDTSGNATNFTQTITVQDTTNPTVTKGSIASSFPTVAEAETAAVAATSASDNCGVVTKTASTTGTCSAVVTVTATDACGNAQSVTYNTRIDNAPPVFSGLPASTLSVQCAADVPALPTVTAMDNCDNSVPVTLTTNQTGTPCNLTITRSWSATDTSGNATNFTQTITVHDTTNPTVTKGSIANSYPTVAAAEAAALAATTASDNCSAVTTAASTTGTCSAVVTVTATDACGNVQSVTYNTRIDNTPPVLSGLPAAMLSVQCETNVPALPAVTAMDNCDNSVAVTLNTNQTGTACNLTITRTWSATDTSGNATNFTQTITVHDTNSPTLTKGTISSNYVTVAEAETAALAATTASDNCSAVTKTASTSGDCPATITVTATDACGNQQSVTYTVCISSAVSLAIRRSGANVTVSWPMPSTGFLLESTMSLNPPAWQSATEAPVANNGRWEVTVPIGSQDRYFRLRHP